jgi:hypothetical protein
MTQIMRHTTIPQTFASHTGFNPIKNTQALHGFVKKLPFLKTGKIKPLF